MADNTYEYEVYDPNTGQTTTQSVPLLPENTFNWETSYGNPTSGFTNPTSTYTPTNTSIGMNYGAATPGGTDTSGGMGTYDANFGFTATTPPASATQVTAEAQKTGWDLSGLASKALDWLLQGDNWKKVAAAAGGVAAFLEANGAKKPTASQAAADQYKAMYDLLHKPVKVNGEMVDLYGPINNIKPMDRMRVDSTGQFIPPKNQPVSGGITQAADGGLIIQRYADGGLVKMATGGSATTTSPATASIASNQNRKTAPGKVETVKLNDGSKRYVYLDTDSGLYMSTKSKTYATEQASSFAGTTFDTSGFTQRGKNQKLDGATTAANYEAFQNLIQPGMSKSSIETLAQRLGLDKYELPSKWTNSALSYLQTTNTNAAKDALTHASTAADIDKIIKQYGTANLPKDIRTLLQQDLANDITSYTTDFTTKQNNLADLSSKLTPGMSDQQVKDLIASYGGKLPENIESQILSDVKRITAEQDNLTKYGQSPSQYSSVDQLYKQFLGRDPTAEEKFYWGSKLLADGVINVQEVSDFMKASTSESDWAKQNKLLSGAAASYTVNDVVNALNKWLVNPAGITDAEQMIIQAVGGYSAASDIAQKFVTGQMKGTDTITSSGKSALTPSDAWTLLAKEAVGVPIDQATLDKFGGRANIEAMAKRYTGAHSGIITTAQVEAYNPNNFAVNVRKNNDGTYTTTYYDGTEALGKPSNWMGTVAGETTADGGTGGDTVTPNVPRTQNLFTGDFSTYGQPGSGGEFQWFNISNPLAPVSGGLLPSSVTGANQPKDAWTGVSPSTTPATPVPSTTSLASSILGGQTYVPPSTAVAPAPAPVAWNAAPSTPTPITPFSPYPGYADGGPVWSKAQHMVPGTSLYAHGGRPRMNGPINGDGHGQEDLIPAQLSDGEYVFDADSVAALGNGSTKAGAALLDKMREEIRKDNRSAPVSEIPPPAKSPLEYLAVASKKVKKGRK